MKLLVDEDLASRELIRRLEAAGIEVAMPDRGTSDEEVWARSTALGAAIVTGNVVDFRRLATRYPSHHGLLLVYRQNDPTRDLRAADIVAGVVSIVSTHPDGLDGLILVVNDFARR